jgi:hypothetical protein
MCVPPLRVALERKEHVRRLLSAEGDRWVASADAPGEVCQMPLQSEPVTERLPALEGAGG